MKEVQAESCKQCFGDTRCQSATWWTGGKAAMSRAGVLSKLKVKKCRCQRSVFRQLAGGARLENRPVWAKPAESQITMEVYTKEVPVATRVQLA